MKAEAQHVAIAEACGYLWFTSPWNKEQKVLTRTQEEADTVRLGGWVWELTPDYLTDLNACHEMEKVIPEAKRGQYLEILAIVADGRQEEYSGEYALEWPCEEFTNKSHWIEHHWTVAWASSTATAAQRCEALCRTLWPERFP